MESLNPDSVSSQTPDVRLGIGRKTGRAIMRVVNGIFSPLESLNDRCMSAQVELRNLRNSGSDDNTDI